MANPRKFSEKIALHTQKQAEETAAFEAILQEVTSATRVSNPIAAVVYLTCVREFSIEIDVENVYDSSDYRDSVFDQSVHICSVALS